MNKQFKLIGAIVLVLMFAIGVTAYMNKDYVEANKTLNEDAVFMIKHEEQIVKSYTMSDIQALGEIEITATKDTSNSGPEDHVYVGVPLIKVYEDAGIKVSESSTIINMAADGYTVALKGEKVLDEDNVILTYKVDGQLLGSREAGGNGPYMIIVAKDQFSQYWCKYALSTEIQ